MCCSSMATDDPSDDCAVGYPTALIISARGYRGMVRMDHPGSERPTARWCVQAQSQAAAGPSHEQRLQDLRRHDEHEVADGDSGEEPERRAPDGSAGAIAGSARQRNDEVRDDAAGDE